MNRSLLPLVAVLVPIAVGFYALLVALGLGPEVGAREGIAAFILMGMLSELMAADFKVGPGRNHPQASLAFLPFLGSIILFAPAVSVVAVTLVVAVSQVFLRRNNAARAALNVAIAGIATGIAALTYHLIDQDALSRVHFVAAGMAAMVFFASNILLASASLSYINGVPFGDMFRRVVGPNGSNLLYDVLASPIAIVPVLLYESSPVLGLIVIVLPLLLINYSYASKKEAIEANKDVLRALVKAIEYRDPYTSGHSVRVSTLAKAIAVDMRLSYRRIDRIETAALLHDIGKIDPIFATILSKPYDLTVEERALIQTHAARGAELLQSLHSVHEEVVAAVLHHHERHDGKGYPAGKAGADIPLAARIIMLCDSIDAMLSDRPYRNALSLATVRAEIARCAGTQFDPTIVDIVLKMNTLERATELIEADAAAPSDRDLVRLTA